MKKVRKAWALTGSEWGVLLRAAGLLLGVEIALRLLPFRTLLSLLRKTNPGRNTSPGFVPISPGRTACLVEVAARHCLPQSACLSKSLVLCALLRRMGVEAKLMIGTTSPSIRFQAHAWVEAEGRIFGSPAAGDYTPLASFEGAGSQRQIA